MYLVNFNPAVPLENLFHKCPDALVILIRLLQF